MLRRVLTLLLCLCLLPLPALAATHQAAPATRFRLSFDMDPEAYPEDVRAYTPGIADFLRELTVEGQLAMAGGEFDLEADVLLSGNERTRTSLRLFGTEALWHIRSSLLGRETLTLDMRAFLEFALKAYSHMDVPLQRVFIWMTPYVHQAPLRKLGQIARDTIYGAEGSHTVSRDDLLAMAREARDEADSNLQFGVWTRALAMESGYDTYLYDLIYYLPEWIESFMPDSGMTVMLFDDFEAWSTEDLSLLRRVTDLSGAQSLSVTLPPMTDGSVITLDAALQPDGDLSHMSLNLTIDDGWGGMLLDLHADGSLPTALPVTREFSLNWDAEGAIVGGEGVHLRFEGAPTASGVVLRQLTPDRDRVMLTVTAELEATQADFSADLDGDSVYALSVSSEALGDLMRNIASPMIRGLLPLIAQAPTSSCQTLMNLLEDSGIFGLLTEGFGNDEDGWYVEY